MGLSAGRLALAKAGCGVQRRRRSPWRVLLKLSLRSCGVGMLCPQNMSLGPRLPESMVWHVLEKQDIC